MKKLLLISITMLSLTVSYGQTSVYHSFPNSDAIWNVTYGGYQAQCSKYSYTLTSDTIVNSVTYKKIYQQKSNYPNDPWTSGCDWCCPSPAIIYYAGALREDIVAKKVFYLPVSASSDTLLYDFNLAVGDPVPLSINNWCPALQVESIDSVLIGTSYRKRWNMADPNINCVSTTSSVIEGIGNTFGLLERFDFFEQGGHLDCFSQNNQSLYPTYSPNSGCPLVSGIEELSPVGFTVSPNPLSDQTTIQFESKLNNATLSLYNCFGQKVKEINNINDQTIILTRDKLTNGLYYAQLTQENYAVTIQLIFTD
ncbi:MAG: hypothetical protein RLZZ531_2039 [Bacteroidota bacterium]|jgi:hypothetical protein